MGERITNVEAILAGYCGERGNSEGAVETLERIIHERDEARKTVERLEKYAGGPIPATAGPIVHPSGAKRSELMPHYASIDASFLWRLAQIHTGAIKGTERHDPRTGFHYHGGDLGYGRGNWHKGLPMIDTFGHLLNHLYTWKEMVDRGVTPHADELGAAVWNIEVLMRFEAQYIEEAARHRAEHIKEQEHPNAR